MANGKRYRDLNSYGWINPRKRLNAEKNALIDNEVRLLLNENYETELTNDKLLCSSVQQISDTQRYKPVVMLRVQANDKEKDVEVLLDPASYKTIEKTISCRWQLLLRWELY